MEKVKFQEIYEKYGERRYPLETVKSIQDCYVSTQKREQAVEAAGGKRKITKQEAISDTKDFFNCLKRCYSGYDYFFTDEECDRIQNLIIHAIRHWPGKISNRRLWFYFVRQLSPILNDSHFELKACNQTQYFRKGYVAYVTDIILCKEKDGYSVVKGTENFPKGYCFMEEEVQDYLMRTIYLGEGCNIDKEYYLLGKYSVNMVKKISLKGKKLKTHRIRCDSAVKKEEPRVVSKDGIFVVNHSTYEIPYAEALLQEYYEEGRNCSLADVVILNLTGNGGGASAYPRCFVEGLNGDGKIKFDGAYLPPPMEIKDEVKKYELYYCDLSGEASFEGTLYVVINKATASSAEMGISSAYSVKNVVCVGSGSLGCSTFGNCVMFQLPNSKILFRFGHNLFYHDGFDEGKGFMPDYWIDDAEPVGVIQGFLKKKKACRL